MTTPQPAVTSSAVGGVMMSLQKFGRRTAGVILTLAAQSSAKRAQARKRNTFVNRIDYRLFIHVVRFIRAVCKYTTDIREAQFSFFLTFTSISDVIMNGLLYKWTNYLTGWQPRWFKLEMPSGELSYYRSEEEVSQGSRGSVKLASCDIAVHGSDPLRLDLHIRGASHKHLYLRATTTQERQKWLVALGSAKACLLEHSSGREPDVKLTSLKEKMAELHMVCQLAVDQVATIKNHAQEPVNSEGLNECATMLSATCSSFLIVLADCMDMADQAMTAGESPTTLHPEKSFHDFAEALNSKNKSILQLHLPKDKIPSKCSRPETSAKLPDPDRDKLLVSDTAMDSITSSVTSDSGPPSLPASAPTSLPSHARTYPIYATLENPQFMFDHPDDVPVISAEQMIIPEAIPSPAFPPRIASPVSSETSSQNETFVSATSSPVVSPAVSQNPLDEETDGAEKVAEKPEPKKKAKRNYETFFSKSTNKFEDVNMDSEHNVSTPNFLVACDGIAAFLNILGGTAFIPVKSDINGNIAKLRKKYQTNPNKFQTLQQIVNDELATNTCTAKNSATDALLWLKRGLEFIHLFLIEVVHGQQDLSVAAGNAYGRTLRRFHGWIVRGVFSLAVKAVPYRKDFMKTLGMPEGETEDQVVQDAVSMANALGDILAAVNLYYQKHNLDTAAVA
eukprot:m.82460 g.82460  ORF g.82460 m.82460 type:complete len:677 (+) comp36292_c0_seq5:1162-3192(+)